MRNDDKENCLVIMPFGKTAEEKLLYNMTYQHIILPAIEDAGWEGSRVDRESAGDEPLSQYIEDRLRTAPLVVADISGNNPNVMFELGARRVHGKPFVCVSSNPSTAEFFARQFQIQDYGDVNAQGKLATAIKRALSEMGARDSSELQLSELTGAIRERRGFKNPFQDRLCSWRLRRTYTEIQSIRGGTWNFQTMTPASYVAYIFQNIISELHEGEEYWTVTNLGFWTDQFVGESELLVANIDAALKGVVVKRVFLVDEQDWKIPGKQTAMNVLHRHLSAVQKVQTTTPGGMQVKCLPKSNFAAALEHFGHFALALHDPEGKGEDGSLIIVPEHHRDGVIRHIKLDFTVGGPRDRAKLRHMELFRSAFSEAVGLEQFLRSLQPEFPSAAV